MEKKEIGGRVRYLTEVEQKQNKLTSKRKFSFKEVVYDNRILHTKKKFTVPNECYKPTQSLSKSSPFHPFKKSKAQFRSYIDTVVRNQTLCRRGPCEQPLTYHLPPPQHQPKRIQTIGEETISFRQGIPKSDRGKIGCLNKRPAHKYSWAVIEKEKQQKKKQLPTLQRKGQESSWHPIRVHKFVSKSATRVEPFTLEKENRQAKNVMQRRLDVESINLALIKRARTDYS